MFATHLVGTWILWTKFPSNHPDISISKYFLKYFMLVWVDWKKKKKKERNDVEKELLQLLLIFFLRMLATLSPSLFWSCYWSKTWCYISFYYKCYLYTNWNRSWCSKELFILHRLCSKIVHCQHCMPQWGMLCCFKSHHYEKDLISMYKDFTGNF